MAKMWREVYHVYMSRTQGNGSYTLSTVFPFVNCYDMTLLFPGDVHQA